MSSVSGWLLDTNVVSELRKGPKAAPSVRFWAVQTRQDEIYVGSLNLAEIRIGIDRLDDQDFAAELRAWLVALRRSFAGRTLAVSEDILVAWCRLNMHGQKSGYTYSQPDSLLAATAIVHGLGVATRNTRDFEQAGITIVNPWLTSST